MFFIGRMLFRGTMNQQNEIRRTQRLVNYALLKAFGRADEFVCINNFAFYDKNNDLRVVDHLLVCDKGVFCIKDIKMIGKVSGSFADEKWYYTNRNKTYSLFNPLKQNLENIYYLNELFKNEFKINSLVVFIHCDIKGIDIPNITKYEDIPDYLDKYEPQERLSKTEQEKIVDKIFKLRDQQNERFKAEKIS